LPGAFHYFIEKVADANKADFVLIDMNPSLGPLNQNFLMTSDLFLIPTAPDYFSMMAIDSLTAILPRWVEWAKRAHELEALKNATYPFPEPDLKLLGTIIQKFRPRKGKATVGFQSWIDEINSRVHSKLVPTLRKHDLTFDDDVYINAGLTTDYCLAQIPDFNTLIAQSQTHQTPVFALTDQMFGHVGSVLEQDQQKREEFRQIFTQLAERVIALAGNA
jgi:cellulose biosynthesis protein BcsQ